MATKNRYLLGKYDTLDRCWTVLEDPSPQIDKRLLAVEEQLDINLYD
jgi:hypothetical protein